MIIKESLLFKNDGISCPVIYFSLACGHLHTLFWCMCVRTCTHTSCMFSQLLFCALLLPSDQVSTFELCSLSFKNLLLCVPHYFSFSVASWSYKSDSLSWSKEQVPNGMDSLRIYVFCLRKSPIKYTKESFVNFNLLSFLSQ